MSKELDEKQKKLAFLKKAIHDHEDLLSIEFKNIQMLSQTVTIEEAHEMYLRGEVTLEEYEHYATCRSGIEYTRDHFVEHQEQIDAMKQEASKLESEIKELEQQEKEARKKKPVGDEKIQIAVGKAVLSVLGTVVGYILFAISYEILNYIIGLIAQIPFLRVILYWPSDASWAKIVLPPMASVSTGAWACVKICGGAKLFSAFIVLLYLASVIIWFVSYEFSLEFLLSCGMIILSACLTFNLKRSDV